ncbi:ammonium transporter [Candidatus Termititenax persephonae]|uniref:Ammonium transporter n=1 Tax=Candidatus Termititenax persephonae TaxID=2218525 RepID=A0A388THD0_9BACT|nr:ammonium transporter [Candidatus Termititenax persephonae]
MRIWQGIFKKRSRRLGWLALAVLSASGLADPVSAGENLVDIAKSIDLLWMLLGGFLVFWMQAGFAMVEAGFTRAKNAVNIIAKNLMDFSVGCPFYFAIGYGIMFGASKAGLFGGSHFLLSGVTDMWDLGFFFFQAMFAATAATIVSGAMAERTNFKAYLFYTVFISALIYPVVGHWIWGGGWLAEKGFLDFAGSTVVHSVGGWAALVGAAFLGPRLGKYTPDGRSKAIPGHNIPLAALGVFILWFGWFGFNGGSTVAATNWNISIVLVTTTLAAAAGTCGALFFSWVRFGKPDVSMALNGSLAGLVSITAPCYDVSAVSSLIIGLLGGILVVAAVEFIDKVLHIDDPVGASSVHLVCGIWGTLALGLFAEPQYGNGVAGLLFGGGLSQLLVQLEGIIAVAVWTIITSSLVFLAAKYLIGLRVSREVELKGLDVPEHGQEAYAGFEIFSNE